ncbi:MAG: glycoside hydrolase family 98 domain-containing protein [Bryobacteraceae bacterium]
MPRDLDTTLPDRSRRDLLQMLATAHFACGLGKAAIKPLRRVVSTKRPLILVEGGRPMWKLLPEDFRPYCAVMMAAGSGLSTSPLFDELAKLQAAGIPVVISVQGDEADSPPTRLDTIAKAFEEFPNLIGCRACELSCGPGMTAPERRNLIDLIRLCGQHRALINWQDMGYPYQREHIFMQAGRDREMFNALLENGESVVLTEKNNGWGKFHQTRSLVLGMWASGIVGNWGFNAEDWWWFEQGYGERFVPSKGRRVRSPARRRAESDQRLGVRQRAFLSRHFLRAECSLRHRGRGDRV